MQRIEKGVKPVASQRQMSLQWQKGALQHYLRHTRPRNTCNIKMQATMLLDGDFDREEFMMTSYVQLCLHTCLLPV